MFTCEEPDRSVLTPVFTRQSFVDDICFGGVTFDECLKTLYMLLTRLAECRISPKVDFLSHEVTSEGIRADPKQTLAIAELPFPKSKKGIQAFLGTLSYYGRFIQNLAVYGAVLYQLKDSDFDGNKDLSAAQAAFAELKVEWQLRQFCAISTRLKRVLKENEVNYHPAEKEVLALLQLLKICHILLAGKVLHVYTQFSTLEWVFQSTSLYGRAARFARVRERDGDFVQLLQASITSHGHVLSFDGSAKTEKNGGYVSCSWILWRLPEWDIEIAASAYLSSTTVNLAEYTGMNNGVKAAIDRGVTDLVIVGDSRLAIQKSMGVIACKKETLQVELARHKELTKKLNSVKYLHVIRLYNSAADSMATEALETQISRVVLNAERKAERQPARRIETSGEAELGDTQPSSQGVEAELNASRTPSADNIDPAVVQAERRRRIDKAQDEELRWADLKAYLRGELGQLSFRRVRNAGKVADDFVLSEDGLLYRHNRRAESEP
ncbi:Hypothetical protein PHPALM_37627 [Phytophthora palmivora]|uniref:RNase H type-1 domain-containing protein n=1 Tax=Phytophthora palmivora TaxID=4796 RepID=A0A2P4WWZ0_9STRA|nr:Hypothetical protein PHPALM_37627 [Phytophthora palmivora]